LGINDILGSGGGSPNSRSEVDVNKLKTQLQSYFGDGLVTIVGTGLSIAEGVPGMPDLQRHLQERMPKTANPAMTSDWSKIASLLTSGSWEYFL